MGSSRSPVVTSSVRPSFPLSARSAQVVRVHAESGRHGVFSHGQRGLSVPLRWRPAHGSLSVASPRSRFHTSSKQALALHASGIVGFDHETLSVHAPVSGYFKRRPVFRRLKSQCVVMHVHSNIYPSVSTVIALAKVTRIPHWRPAAEVSARKAESPVVQQTPNPSFKRTRLRRSA
jgi:hypothetical protein